jgi:hypothetical protein
MKKCGVGFLKILWETDKALSTSSNLVCVYTHPKFQNMKFNKEAKFVCKMSQKV